MYCSLYYVYCTRSPRFSRFEADPVFRAALEDCARIAEPWSPGLLNAMFNDEERLSHTEYSQPAIVALEIALAASWEAKGVKPQVMEGPVIALAVTIHLMQVAIRGPPG